MVLISTTCWWILKKIKIKIQFKLPKFSSVQSRRNLTGSGYRDFASWGKNSLICQHRHQKRLQKPDGFQSKQESVSCWCWRKARQQPAIFLLRLRATSALNVLLSERFRTYCKHCNLFPRPHKVQTGQVNLFFYVCVHICIPLIWVS